MGSKHKVSNMLSSIDHESSVEQSFDKIAGAAFALGWLCSLTQKSSRIDSPIFGWLLSMNALVESEQDTNPVDQILTDFDALVVEPSAFDLDIGQQFRTDLKIVAQREWSFWLPLLLFSLPAHRDQHWNNFQTRFSAATEEERALRRLLFDLLREPDRELLFTPDINSRYSSLAEAIVVRVGKLLKELKVNSEDEQQQQVFSRWYDFTRQALSRVHSGLRLGRTLRPDTSEYIDLLFALLAVAEWRAQPDIWRIPTFIESYRQYPEEAFTTRQLALSSVLFGYFEGYHRVAAGVQQLPLRRFLASQAMALVATHHVGEGISTPTFYLPRDTEDSSVNWILIDEIESQCTTRRSSSVRKGMEQSIKLAYRASIKMLVPQIGYHFSYEMEYSQPNSHSIAIA